jgi:putative ABC transport system permease protein
VKQRIVQWQLFRRLILRPMLHDRFRTALTALSIALGVSVVIAIDLAGTAAAGSFESSVETLSGKASLTISAVGGVDEKLLGKLVRLPYPFRFAPRIEDFATPGGHGAALPFLGLDLIGGQISEGAETSGDLSNIENPIFAGSGLGWRKNDVVQLLINDRIYTCTVAGLLPESPGGVGENNAILADIGLAQLLTGKLGRIDSIAVSTPGYGSLDHWEALLKHELPVSVTVERAGARTNQNRKMLAAFRWNLRILSYIAVVVGAFLIYNTIAVSVVRRRPEIGVVRALGATRGAVLTSFLLESAVFGVAGGLAGLAIGRLFAIGAVNLIGNTVEMLYVSSQPAPVQFSARSVLAALAIGIGVSIVSALAPATEASRVSPTEAMARGRREYIVRHRWGRYAAVGLALTIAAAIAAAQPAADGRPLFGYLSAALLIGATASFIPIVIQLGSHLLAPVMQRIAGVELFLAIRSLRASLNRASVLVGALTTAIAMMTSVGIMVGSFRETVAIWMDNQLRADFYLRPAGSSAADRHPTIGPGVADEIERLPGVAAVDRFRVYPITYDGLPASLGGGETKKVQATSATYFLPGENRSRILAQLPRGDNVIVSEPFANKHHVKSGDMIKLPIGGSIRAFRVLGVYYDYSTERGFVVMDRRTLLRYLPDPAASNLAVYLKQDANPADVRKGIERVIGARGLMLFTNSKLRKGALDVFDRTFQITWALEAVAIAVAVIGIAGALLALVIDRRREYALLRFLGAERRQIRRIILAEAGFLGIFSNAIGLVLGTGLSLVLIFVINKQSFGWTIQFHWPVLLMVLALTGVYIATVLAGLYPAHAALRMKPIEVIHEE